VLSLGALACIVTKRSIHEPVHEDGSETGESI
jgi:hypothetical protein